MFQGQVLGNALYERVPGTASSGLWCNTSCVEVSMGVRRVIFDLGTGVRNLGKWFMRKQVREAKGAAVEHAYGGTHITAFRFSRGLRRRISLHGDGRHLDNGLKIRERARRTEDASVL